MNTTVRDRYIGDTVSTATPQSLLVRLYDRLVLDLEGAEQAIAECRYDAVNSLIGHAQDIVTELDATLVVDAWEGGPALAQLYRFCQTELVQANVTKDASRVAGVRGLLQPLRDAWREAALAIGSAQPASASLTA